MNLKHWIWSICALVAGCAQVPGGPMQSARVEPLALSQQGSFFVGGQTRLSDTLSSLPAFPASGSVAVDQMYVRYQIPASPTGTALVLVHGCCLTGKTWETTPDGRMGWDEYFLRASRPVYVVDQSARGRSGGDVTALVAMRLGRMAASESPPAFMLSREAAWQIFRFGPAFGQPHFDTQFPVDAIEEFWKQMVPDWTLAGAGYDCSKSPCVPTAEDNATVRGLSELARRLRSIVVISHSQSGIYPFKALTKAEGAIKAIVAIEPGACPSAKGDLQAYLRVPSLIVWGDHAVDSPHWGNRVEDCRKFALAVQAAGGRAENVVLPSVGLRGNSHMLMQDRNNLDVARWIEEWLRRNS